MSDWRRNTLKTMLQLLSQLLWVMGLLVGLSGVYLLMNFRQSSLFFSYAYIILPAVLALASAVFLVVAGYVGSCLSVKDSTCLQGLFVYLLVLVFCLESTASALAYFHSTKLDSELAHLSEFFQKYTGSYHDLVSQAVDATQEKFQCCGAHGYQDWLESPWFNRTGGFSVPHSCCNSTFPSCNGTVDQPWQLYTQGCQDRLEMVLKFLLRFIILAYPVVFLLEAVLFVMVTQLMREQPFMEYQILDKKSGRKEAKKRCQKTLWYGGNVSYH